MPLRQGWDSQFGIADETTYGTPVTPTRFYEIDSGDIKLEIETIRSSALRAGRLNVNRSSAYARWKKQATGTVEMEVKNKGFGLLLKHMCGGVATTGSAGVFTHTASLATLVGDFFTAQLSRGAQPHTYHGCKITGWELSVSVGGLLMLSIDIDSEEEDTTTALATASYPTSLVPFSFLDGLVTIGGTTTHVKSLSITAANNQDVDRHFIRQSGLKKEPVDQGRTYTGTFEVEYEDQVVYDRFINGTEAELVATFVGGTISGPDKFTLTVTLPSILAEGETPSVSGPETIMLSAPFTVQDDSGTIAYKTSDATP